MSSPYDGIEMPKPPKGYRLAEWGERYDGECLWYATPYKEWWSWPSIFPDGAYEVEHARGCFYAIPKPRITIPLVPVTDSFEDFKASVEAKYGHPHLRNGQIAYRELRTAHENIAAWVFADFGIDPFYNDDNLPAFWACVKERWDQ